ncbi:MAG: hypothetical protein PUA84_05610 [Oscillospiraceae bacterium]|nr:hypothetical protein [Oscillospiraceae bacterium]
MAKVKEQVKYNPKWSGERRVNAARKAVSGQSNAVLTIVFFIFSLILLGVVCVSIILNPEGLFEDGFQSVSSITFSGTFMSFFIFALNSSLPYLKVMKNAETKQKAMLGGCVSIFETFLHMPVKKISLFRQTFRYFCIFVFFGIAPGIIMNVCVMLKPELYYAGGMASVSTIVAVMFIVGMYCANFGVFGVKNEAVQKAFGVILAAFYIFWIGCMLGLFDEFILSEPFCAIAGLPCIILAVLCIAAVFAVEKLYVEKREKNGYWIF